MDSEKLSWEQLGKMAQSGIPRGARENSFKAGEKQVHSKKIQALR